MILPFAEFSSKRSGLRFSFLQPFQLFPERGSQTESNNRSFSRALEGTRLPARMRVTIRPQSSWPAFLNF